MREILAAARGEKKKGLSLGQTRASVALIRHNDDGEGSCEWTDLGIRHDRMDGDWHARRHQQHRHSPTARQKAVFFREIEHQAGEVQTKDCECPARGTRHSATHRFVGIEHRHRERGAWDSKKLFRRARIESNRIRSGIRSGAREGASSGTICMATTSAMVVGAAVVVTGASIYLVQDEKD